MPQRTPKRTWGIGATVVGADGEVWGDVVTDEGKAWKLSTGRVAKKSSAGERWHWRATEADSDGEDADEATDHGSQDAFGGVLGASPEALANRAALVWATLAARGADSGGRCFAGLCARGSAAEADVAHAVARDGEGTEPAGLADAAAGNAAVTAHGPGPSFQEVEALVRAAQERSVLQDGSSQPECGGGGLRATQAFEPWTAVGTFLDPATLAIRCAQERPSCGTATKVAAPAAAPTAAGVPTPVVHGAWREALPIRAAGALAAASAANGVAPIRAAAAAERPAADGASPELSEELCADVVDVGAVCDTSAAEDTFRASAASLFEGGLRPF